MSEVIHRVEANETSDRACLQAWRHEPGAQNMRPLVERYLAFVYSSACRRTGSSTHASEVTRAVFLVLARRARKLRKKTLLASWLYHITAVACRKLSRTSNRAGRRRWFRRGGPVPIPADAPLWTQIAPHLDHALDRLRPAHRNAVLLRALLNKDWPDVAQRLRTTDQRARKRVARGLEKLSKRLGKRGVIADSDTLALLCRTEACPPPDAQVLIQEILASIERSGAKRPSSKLARQTLSALAWIRWRRRILFGAPCLAVLMGTLGATAWYIDSLSGHSRLMAIFFFWSVRHEAKTIPGLAQPARPWPRDSDPRLSAASIHTARDLYQSTNIWLAHLKLSGSEWKTMQPKDIGVLPNFFQSDGTVLLRNPNAQRSGLAGVLGLDFNWTHADFEFGGRTFTNIAARFKGNGTYVTSLYGPKRPFKVDLNKFAKGQKLGGVDELTFHNLVDDRSYMSDALAYEFFGDAGVPASRTAYAYLSISVDGKWQRQPLGLYVMVEAVDAAFAADRFGSRTTPLFKPVTYELFEHLGDDWSSYAAIYDLKTHATVEQLRRVIDFGRLLSHAGDSEFAARLGDFLDIDEFARFLAVEVLLSSYDGILSDGQNFYVYLDSKSNKFGFIPWDLDLAWGGFFIQGSTRDRERASIWHPWVGRNRFLERVMAVEQFRKIYRAHLEDFSARLFVPARLYRRIDDLAAVIRSPIAAESDFRLAKFDQAVSDKPADHSSAGKSDGANRPVHQLKRFIKARAASVRRQLDGKSEGVILKRSRN